MHKIVKKALTVVCLMSLLTGFAACQNKEKETEKKVTPTVEATKAPEATKKPTLTPIPTVTKAPKVTKAPEATKAPEETESAEAFVALKDVAAEHGFSFGTVASAYSGHDLNYMMALMDDFNSVTAANEMKAYSMLDQKASQWREDGMPAIDFTQGDNIVSMAEVLGIGVRGHVLVWDAYMCDWFFREGYTDNGPYVDRETMLKRLQYYIETVMTHFETEFPGVVYCWDVVNEAVGDSPSDSDTSDSRHIRTLRGAVKNPFYNVIGDDYVEISFLYAANTVAKLKKANPEVSIQLFYNDYNTFIPDKRDAICELVKSINHYAKDANGNYRKLCEGVGMQSYIGGYGVQEGCMSAADIGRIRTAVEMFSDLGVDVHITEMAVRNYDETLMDQHAEFYGRLFDMFVELNRDKTRITNISIWGLNDAPWMDESNGNYKQNSPYCGLYDEDYKRKDAYYKVLEAMQKETE